MEPNEDRDVSRTSQRDEDLPQPQTGAAGNDGPAQKPALEALVSRRHFLYQAGTSATAAGLALSALGTAGAVGLSVFPARRARAEEIGPVLDEARADQAFYLRVDVAKRQRSYRLPIHPCNGDDVRYPDGRISYTKALPHDGCGIGDPNAYKLLREAIKSGNPDDFENIPLGGVVKQVDPQAALAFDLEGADSHHLYLPPAPGYQTPETAAEMVELYWQALTRDIAFNAYTATDDERIAYAAKELTNLPAFTGPRIGGEVTPQTLFRIDFPGVLDGPYVSQFLLRDVPYGAEPFEQRLRTVVPNLDYLTNYYEWLSVQNGARAGENTFDPTRRFIRNERDIGEYVHRDFPAQSFINAALILLNLSGTPNGPSRVFDSGFAEALPSIFDEGNPYLRSRTQAGFTQFGGPDILALVADVTNHALRAAWYQKWSIHRRLRPEEYGGRIQVLRDRRRFPPFCVVPVDDSVLNSEALRRTYDRWGSYLLPQAFPEGSPSHPAYPSGHAVYSGACVALLKAFFNEDFELPGTVVASSDGTALNKYDGGQLTVGGELNKLAANVAIARNGAGVHWRSDAQEGLLLGEQVGIRYLQDLVRTYNQSFRNHPSFPGYHLTRFDGTRIRLNRDGTITYLSPQNGDDLS